MQRSEGVGATGFVKCGTRIFRSEYPTDTQRQYGGWEMSASSVSKHINSGSRSTIL